MFHIDTAIRTVKPGEKTCLIPDGMRLAARTTRGDIKSHVSGQQTPVSLASHADLQSGF